MSKKSELPHHGQILTTKAAILDDMRFERSLFKGLLYCAAAGRAGGEYQAVLCGTCMKLWFLSRLVYRGKDGIAKLPAARYKRGLFDTWMEDEEEISAQLRRLNLGDADAALSVNAYSPSNCCGARWSVVYTNRSFPRSWHTRRTMSLQGTDASPCRNTHGENGTCSPRTTRILTARRAISRRIAAVFSGASDGSA